MRTADFDFTLPPELIAQAPLPQRDQSRLLVLHRFSGQVEHRRFRDLLNYLQPGDLLALNNSRVIPARLRGVNARTGGQFEILLLEENAINDWWAMLRPGKRARTGTQIILRDARGQPGGLTGGIHTTDLHRHCRDTGQAQHQHHDQRGDGESRLDGACARTAGYTLVLSARPMMLVSAVTMEWPVTTV